MTSISQLKKIYGIERFTDLLMPCEAFDGHYFLADGGLGQIWEIDGFGIDGKTQQELDSFSTRLRGFFLSSYEDVSYQLITVVHRGAAGIGKLFSGNPNVNPAVAEYLQRKMDFHQRGIVDGFFQEGNRTFSPKTIKQFMTAKVLNPQGKVLSKEQWGPQIAKLEKVETVIESSLSVNEMKYKRVTPDSLIDTFFRILGPKTSTAIASPAYAGGDLRDYMLKTSPRLENGFWLCDDYSYKVVSFKKNPAVSVENDGKAEYGTEANMLFREQDGISLLDYLDNFIFTIDFHMPNSQKIAGQIDRKRTLTFMNRLNFMGDTSIDKQLIKEDTDKITHAMYSGNKVLKASYHLCFPVDAGDPDIQLRTQQVIASFDRLGCAAVEEDLISSAIFLRALPFGFNHTIPGEDVVQRSYSVMASNLADLAPFYRNSRGSHTDVGALYYNRRGEDVLLDVFDAKTASTAPHCMITGETGAGKSVMACDFILQSMRQEPHIIVIDKGNSYKRICEYLNGQYLKFEGAPTIKLDPFVGSKDDDHRAFLVSLLGTMVTGGAEQISREEVATLSETVFRVLGASADPSLNDIQTHLTAEGDQISRSLAKKLFPFYGNGQYSRFFEGDKPSLKIGNRFTVFELGDMEAHKDLQAVIVSQLIHYVTEFVKTLPGKRKFLLIDESWSLFRNENAVQFLVGAVKTFRKLGCSVMFLTQQPDDFKIVAEALNMSDNCPNQIFLRQNYDVISRMKDALGLSDGQLAMLRSLRKGARYSEAFIKTQGWQSIVRILLDTNGYWLTTSKDSDTAYLHRLMENMSLQDSIQRAAKEHPFGVTA